MHKSPALDRSIRHKWNTYIFGIPIPLCMYTITMSIYTEQTQ
jgi:hypothetical protein